MDVLLCGHLRRYGNDCVLVSGSCWLCQPGHESSFVVAGEKSVLTFTRFMIEDMTSADLLAQDQEFEEYLCHNGWEGAMQGLVEVKT